MPIVRLKLMTLGRNLNWFDPLTATNIKGTWACCISAKLVLRILHSQGPRRWGTCMYERSYGNSQVTDVCM